MDYSMVLRSLKTCVRRALYLPCEYFAFCSKHVGCRCNTKIGRMLQRNIVREPDTRKITGLPGTEKTKRNPRGNMFSSGVIIMFLPDVLHPAGEPEGGGRWHGRRQKKAQGAAMAAQRCRFVEKGRGAPEVSSPFFLLCFDHDGKYALLY